MAAEDGSSEAVALSGDGLPQRAGESWYRCQILRESLRELMERSDAAGWANFGPWVALLLASGSLAYVSWGTWWAVPAFFVYGTLYTSSDAHWHECAHRTAFRTRWLNEGFYHLLSFMCLREAYLWRWSHARHHAHTMMTGYDPEITVPRPADLTAIVCDFLYLHSGFVELRKIVLHAAGIMTPGARDFVHVRDRRKSHVVHRLGRQRRAQAARAEKDELLARGEHILVIRAFGIDPEFQQSARRVEGASDAAVAPQLAHVADVDELQVGIGHRRLHLVDRHRLDRRFGLGDHLFDAFLEFHGHGSAAEPASCAQA